MIRAGSGLSLLPDAADAGREAGSRAFERSGGPADLALVLVSHHHAAHLKAAAAEAGEATKARRTLGCSGYGVLTEEREVEETPAVAVLALASDRMEIVGAHAQSDRASGRELGALLARRLSAASPRALLLLPGPGAGWPEELMSGLGIDGHRNVPIFGAGLSGPWSDEDPSTLVAGEVLRGSTLAAAVLGQASVAFGASAAMGPIGKAHVVTRVQGDRIEELSSRQAQHVLAEEVGPTLWGPIQKGEKEIFVAVASPGTQGALEKGRYTVRSMLGFDPRGKSLISHQPVQEGETVGFAMRCPFAARNDFQEMLAKLRSQTGPKPAFGILFDCCARGRDLYGQPDVDVTAIREAFPGVPVAGLFGSFELCPVDGENRLQAYTAVLVMVGEQL